jgi:hypothetical protein
VNHPAPENVDYRYYLHYVLLCSAMTANT